MTHALSMLALVTDAYGGRGGIAQYNRDLSVRFAPHAELYSSDEAFSPGNGSQAVRAHSARSTWRINTGAFDTPCISCR